MCAERAAHKDTIYFYQFNYYKQGSLGLMALLLPFEAASHCLELPYFFGKSIISEFTPDLQDEQMIEQFTTYITTFIKTGYVGLLYVTS